MIKSKTVEVTKDIDKALGDIHECALVLHLAGQADWATRLATAHEHIQALYLLASDLYERLDYHRIPLTYQTQQEIDALLLKCNAAAQTERGEVGDGN